MGGMGKIVFKYLQHYLPDDAVVVVTDEDPQVGREMLEAPVTAFKRKMEFLILSKIFLEPCNQLEL